MRTFSHPFVPGTRMQASHSLKLMTASDITLVCECRSCNAESIVAELSGLYTQHSILIRAHVPPYTAVRVARTIWFCRMAFLTIIFTSDFNNKISSLCIASERFNVPHYIFKSYLRTKDSGQVIIPVENPIWLIDTSRLGG